MAAMTIARREPRLSAPVEERRRVGGVTGSELNAVAGSAVAALSLVWLLLERLLPLSGALGFWLCWYAVFTALYCAVSVVQARGSSISDRLATVVFHSAGASLIAITALIVGYTAYRGAHAISPHFFTSTMESTSALAPLSSGGVAHAMVGSLEQVGLGVLFSVPLGISAAIYLNEVKGGWSRPLRMIVDAMSAIPSIVAGLFVLATVVLTLGYSKSGLAAALAISIEMLPVVTRSAELVLRLVPGGLREAAAALGSTRWRTVWSVVLPTARSGLTTSLLLGIARGVGETAPVLLVSGFTAAMNVNPFHGAQMSLPLYILTYVKYPQQVMITRAYGAALALLTIVLVAFVAARLIGGRRPGSGRAHRRARPLRPTSTAAPTPAQPAVQA